MRSAIRFASVRSPLGGLGMADEPFDASKVAGGDAAYEPQRLQLIGQIASDWTLCEQILEFVIWTLIGVDHKIGECITTDLPNLTRQTIAKNLINRFHRQSANYDRYMLILTLFDECRQARNDAIHPLVLASPDDFFPVFRSMKSGSGNIRIKPAQKEPEELQITSHAIGWLMSELARFQDALRGEPFPSHDKDLLPVYAELLERLRRNRQSHDLPPQS